MCCFSLLIATSNRYLQTGLFFIRTFSNVAIPMLEKPLQTMFSWYFFRAGIACLIYDSFFSAILWEWCIFGSWSYTSKCKMISSSFKDYQVMKFCIIPNWKCHEPFLQRTIIIIRSTSKLTFNQFKIQQKLWSVIIDMSKMNWVNVIWTEHVFVFEIIKIWYFDGFLT